MPPQVSLRPLRWSDLPALKRWRGLPDVSRHLRHPKTSWLQHLRWFLSKPSVWAVEREGKLVGQVGWYYRVKDAAEVSVLVMDGDREDYAWERVVVSLYLAPLARAHGLKHLWAEVLSTAPLGRHHAVSFGQSIGDSYSTFYRWSIA